MNGNLAGGMNNGVNNGMGNNGGSQRGCRDTLNRIRAVDFAMTEANLYLDVYPDSKEALAFYHQLKDERERLVASYERQCGPLSVKGNESRNDWNWISSPWPWEAEANK